PRAPPRLADPPCALPPPPGGRSGAALTRHRVRAAWRRTLTARFPIGPAPDGGAYSGAFSSCTFSSTGPAGIAAGPRALCQVPAVKPRDSIFDSLSLFKYNLPVLEDTLPIAMADMPSSNVPLYHQIAQVLRRRIESGDLGTHGRLAI